MRLYHNIGNANAGSRETPPVRSGLGNARDWPISAAWADLDNDGDLGLFVANDTTANYFFRKLGGFRFVEQAAGGRVGGEFHWRIPCGKWASPVAILTATGRLDLAVTNFLGRSDDPLYHNHGGGLFSDRTSSSRPGRADSIDARTGLARCLTPITMATLIWRKPMAISATIAQQIRTRCPRSYFSATVPENSSKSRVALGRRGRSSEWRAGWRLATSTTTAASTLCSSRKTLRSLCFTTSLVGVRRISIGRNLEQHFVVIELEGTASNRDAISAKVRLTAGGVTQFAERFGGASYASASDKRLHFGLGANNVVNAIEVIWPSGQRDRFEGLPADTGYRLLDRDSSGGIPISPRSERATAVA